MKEKASAHFARNVGRREGGRRGMERGHDESCPYKGRACGFGCGVDLQFDPGKSLRISGGKRLRSVAASEGGDAGIKDDAVDDADVVLRANSS